MMKTIFKCNRLAFTLAEVLITLLIVGVIASIVIPGLIADSQNAEYKAAYKKAFAVASNATKKASFESLFSSSNLDNFNTFKNQFNVVKECINNNNDQCWNSSGEKACDGTCGGGGLPISGSPAFIDGSGMEWSLFWSGDSITLVDTNGHKGPNKYGKDRWVFVFAFKNGQPYKVSPYYNIDIEWTNDMCCHYPPCYFKKWLTE